MGFLSDDKTDDQAHNWAVRLRNCVIASGTGQTPKYIYLTEWTKHFALLRKEQGEELVEKVLGWYERNYDKQYTPKALSGATFRQKFEAIRAAMNRSEDSPEEEIDQRSKDLAKVLSNNWNFPVEIQSQLPKIIQKTRDNWKRFHWSLTKIDGSPREDRFLSVVLDTYSPSFIQDWIIFISNRYGKQQHYTGPVMSLAWTKDSPQFRQSFWRQWSLEWCGSPLTFEDLLDRLIKENK